MKNYSASAGWRGGFAVPVNKACPPHLIYFIGNGNTCPARRLLGSSCVTLVFSSNACRVDANSNDRHACDAPFVHGISPAATLIESDGSNRSVWLSLTPICAAALFGLPGSELRDQAVSLETLLGSEARALVEFFATRRSQRQCAEAVGSWLQRRILTAPKMKIPPDMIWAWRQLTFSLGGAPINSLTAELGCSRRYLSQRFAEIIGITPKVYGRMIRFDCAMANLLSGDGDLTSIALKSGYYDHAHFDREVREFTGTTPTGLLASQIVGGADLGRLELARSSSH